MLSRLDPFTDLFRVQSQLNRLFDDSRIDSSRGTAWLPSVDVHEDAERLLFTVDLPGVRKEDVSVRVDGGVLTIEGSRNLELEEKRKGYHRVERAHGKFSRSFALPDSVNTDSVEAELKEGVLSIVLPKKEDEKPRTIEIKV